MSGFQFRETLRFFLACRQRSDGGARFNVMFDQYYFCLMFGIDAASSGR